MHAYKTRELKSIALERWYQFDPDGARQEAMHQIGSSHPSITAESLHFLGDQRLPEFENIWANALLETADEDQEQVFTSLLAHFGTGAALAAVRGKLEAKLGEWACVPQGAALGYVVKFNPTSARALVEQAVQARGPGKSGCNHSTFQNLALYSHDPMLREVALEFLNDPDPEVTQDALDYLKHFGEASDQQPISERFADWILRWHDHADELDRPTNWKEAALGKSLASALTENQAWLASEQLIRSTLDRCIGEQMCQSLRAIAFTQTQPYPISAYGNGGDRNYRIAQYSPKSLEQFDAKIAQFPKGTRFSMRNDGLASEEQKRLDGGVKDLLEKHGMVVEPKPTNQLPLRPHLQ